MVNIGGPLDSEETTHKVETRGHAAVTRSRHVRHGASEMNHEAATTRQGQHWTFFHRVRPGSNADNLPRVCVINLAFMDRCSMRNKVDNTRMWSKGLV